MVDILLAGKTDVGLKRANNEDVFVTDAGLNYCLVADGMGGAAAGEIASRYFAETACSVFSEIQNPSKEDVYNLVQKVFILANKKIIDHIKASPEHSGMGCTAELLAFSGHHFVLGHMGDSRTYCFRGERLKQLTSDHSLVQSLVDQKVISPEEARHHPHRNIILRAVGIEENIALDIIRGKARPGDVFLLCSDGLTDMVDDALLLEVMSSPSISLEQKVEGFVDLAKLAGGHDNVTVVLAQLS